MIYIAIYLMMALVGLALRPDNQKGALLAILICLLFFMGWREFVGCDFNGYANRFFLVSPLADPWEALDDSEPSFQFLITAVRTAGLHYMWLNIFSSAIILICVYIFLRNFAAPIIILASLFPIFIMQLAMSGLRQAIATSMLMAGCAAFLNGRRLAVAAWILAGATFHASVALFLPLAVLAARPLSIRWLIASAVVAAPLVVWIMSDRMDDYSDRYIDQIYGQVSSGGAIYRYALVFVPSALFFMYRSRFAQRLPREFQLFQIFALMALAIAPLAVFSTIALHRITFYILPVCVVIFTYAHYCFYSQSTSRLFRVAPLIAFGVYMLGWLYLSRHADICYLPYKSYLV